MERPSSAIRIHPLVALALAIALLGPSAVFACTTYPSGVASTDRVLSFLPSSGVFHDRPQSSAGSATEGMVVYDTTTNTVQFCDGTNWHALTQSSSSGETSGTPIAAISGANSYKALGNLEISADQTIPIRLNSIDFMTTEWKAISKGPTHTCAIQQTTDRLYCWGNNTSGQLGNGTNNVQIAPGPLSSSWNTTAWKDVAAGSGYTCAIRLSDDRLYCWGINGYGQLGTGNTNPVYSPTALNATGGWNTTAWKSVSARDSYTCAIRLSDDRLFCWGYNQYGMLGNGDTTAKSSPTALTATNGWDTTAWKSVTTGYLHTCAIRLSDDRLFCWGYNGYGQLGTGDTSSGHITPTPLSATGGWDSTAWNSVTTGGSTTCAIRLSDSRLFCWGGNDSGQLGTGDTTQRVAPTTLNSTGSWDSQSWKSVVTGSNQTCAIRSDDLLFCWGRNDYGQSGNGTTSQQNNPTALSTTQGWNTTGWKAVTSNLVGTYPATCAIRALDNRAFCWGHNSNSQLGDGLTTNTSIPTALLASRWSNTAWKSASTAAWHTCGIRQSDDLMFCWGSNDTGQLGVGNTQDQGVPTALRATGGWNTTTWKAVSAGDGHTCAIRLSDNRLFCWGEGLNGKLGNGNTSTYSYPIPLNATGGWDTTEWKAVAAGYNHTCAIRSDDRLFCWGSGLNGRLGSGDTLSQTSPVALSSSGGWDTTTWKSVSVAYDHTCAIRLTDDLLFCWGGNSGGQLGDGGSADQSIPVALSASGGWNTTTWKMVETGDFYTCAIRLSDDRLFCWGANTYGMLGTGDTTERSVPTPLTTTGSWNTTSWSTVSAGSSNTYAIRLSDRQLFRWGAVGSIPGPLASGWDSIAWQSVSVSSSNVIALEGPANFQDSFNSPPNVGTDDFVVRFPNLYGQQRAGKPSLLGSSGWNRGTLAYDSTGNHLRFSNGNRWLKVSATTTGTVCSSYPDATNTRVIEFKADGSSRTYNSTRTARTSPRAGSLIYNSSLHKLQYCDGTNWQTVDRDPAVITYSTPGTYSYTVPQDITTLSIESWGGGAGGGNQAAQANGGGGGGYSKKTISVTPSETLTIIVGSGGATGVNGGDSSVKRDTTTLATATGGLTAGGASPTPGAGYYDIWYPGGAGAAAQGGGGGRAGSGGGGGGGSSSAGAAGGAGASATPGTGGAGGTPDGGAGGDGGAPAASGANGSFPGGGGGGSGSSSSVSGTGGNGQIKILVP